MPDQFHLRIGRRMKLRTALHFAYEKVQAFTKKNVFIYMQCYFVTIATILGTGVLGLPVTLSQSGLWPFMMSFAIGFFMQALLIVFMADLLQKAVQIQASAVSYSVLEQDTFAATGTASRPSAADSSSSSNDEKVEYLDMDKSAQRSTTELEGEAAAAQTHLPKPNLHLLGELFLPRGLRELFNLLLLFQFLALLISYCLAGSQAFADLLHVSLFYTIPVFCWSLALLVVFAMKFVQPFVSVLTFFKGTMLLITVALTFGVGASIQREISNDFGYSGASFLMGTVALGGVANVMPYLYEKISASAKQVRRFRLACFFGLATCVALNIAWCWAVLDIVPQSDAIAAASCTGHGSALPLPLAFNWTTAPQSRSNIPLSCSQNISLESARRNGEISTIPLTRIIQLDYPSYSWVAMLVQLFIVVSITVSFLINGSVLYHTVKGLLKSKWPQRHLRCWDRKHFKTMSVVAALVQLCLFGIVFGVSMANPQSFVKMLEKVASFSLNIEVALFFTVMFWKSCNKDNRGLVVPASLPDWFLHTRHLMTLYFAFAVGYDIVISIMEAVEGTS